MRLSDIKMYENESPRHKQRGIVMDYIFDSSPQAAGNKTHRDLKQPKYLPVPKSEAISGNT